MALLYGCQAPQVYDSATPPCAADVSTSAWRTPRIYDRGGVRLDFDTFVDRLSDARVVAIGEAHTRYDHHLTQLEIVCRLHRRHPDMALGVEFVQRPFQPGLEDYVGGRLEMEGLLRAIEYYKRWAYDFRLYAPLMRLARQARIPVVALNVPVEITGKVSDGGLAALSASERAQIPTRMAPASPAYRSRMHRVFEQHPAKDKGDFEHFLGVQLLWDEGMAASAADYLSAHPGRALVVLAGNGHVAFREAIPERLAQRAGTTVVSVSQETVLDGQDVDADFRLSSSEVELPAAGRLGVFLDVTSEGVAIRSFSADSAAERAGMEAGDRIAMIDGHAVHSYADVKMALWKKAAGDAVSVRITRLNASRSYEFSLH